MFCFFIEYCSKLNQILRKELDKSRGQEILKQIVNLFVIKILSRFLIYLT